jgi:hypothetical protein
MRIPVLPSSRWLITSIVLATAVSSGQQIRTLPTDTLAEVAGKAITARDLQERLELMPWPGKEHVDQTDSVKIRALQSIVAEHLLATEAAARGIGNDSASVRRLRSLERLLVRDELYRREILPKATPTKAEVQEGTRRAPWSVRALLLVSANKKDAARVVRAFRGGDPDSTARALPPGLVRQQDTLTISLGEAEKAIEDTAYTLSATKPAAGPFLLRPAGWAVLALRARIPNDQFLQQSIPDRIRNVENAVRRAKEADLAGKYYASFLSSRKAEANPVLFDRFASAALEIFRSDSLRFRKQGAYSVGLIVDTLQSVLEPILDSALVQMDGGPMTTGEVLDGYRYLHFSFPDIEERDFRARLNGSIREIIAAEYLAREGFRQNLQHSEAVRHDVATWADYWNSLMLERSLRDSVTITDEDVMNFLTENGGILGSPYEVNIREILTDSLSTSTRMLEQLLNGADMAQLARRFSRRKEWAERGGESLWFRVSGYPELGFRALEADAGAIIGPLKVRNGYSLFKVLGKRLAPGDSLISFDSLKTVVRQKVRAQKVQQLLNHRIAGLARSQGVRMRYGQLRGVDVTRQNMVTRRLIGFGGTIIAVPTLIPQYLWINEARDIKDILP